ncbi:MULTISPECIES: copper chaperone PCu(A)C [unclassified Streptomyces]|uniref:copper chaperone PCu(A)C n=1 Tax=unclassified Streptomyces TaxID=2593676 RepID=UPI00068CF025|nr:MULTISPECIES: copper chaperone PCu(A)C [unclassified Streptomyces]
MTVRSLIRGIAPLTVAASVLLTGGCAGSEGEQKPPYSAPGANADLGRLAIRYVHAAHPEGGSWRAGSDVPVYLYVRNEGDAKDTLVAAKSDRAESVALVDGEGHELPDGITVAPETTGKLYAGKPHLELRHIGERLRAGDFLKLTLTFRKAGSTTLTVPTQVIEPSSLPPSSPEPTPPRTTPPPTASPPRTTPATTTTALMTTAPPPAPTPSS